MSPKMINKEERKVEIALVALDLFAEHGFEGTSISQVAQVAGIGKGTVYEYFASKDELFASALAAWMDAMIDEIEHLMQEIVDPEELLRAYARASVDIYVNDKRTVNIMLIIFQRMLRPHMELTQNEAFRQLFRKIRKAFVDILLGGVAKGCFKPEIARDAERLVINLFAYLDGIGFHCLVGKDDFILMDQVNFYMDQFIASIKLQQPEQDEESAMTLTRHTPG